MEQPVQMVKLLFQFSYMKQLPERTFGLIHWFDIFIWYL